MNVIVTKSEDCLDLEVLIQNDSSQTKRGTTIHIPWGGIQDIRPANAWGEAGENEIIHLNPLHPQQITLAFQVEANQTLTFYVFSENEPPQKWFIDPGTQTLMKKECNIENDAIPIHVTRWNETPKTQRAQA